MHQAGPFFRCIVPLPHTTTTPSTPAFRVSNAHQTQQPPPSNLASRPQSSTAARPSNKGAIRILTPTLARLRILNAIGAISTIGTIIIPEESPAIAVDVGHLRTSGRRARVRDAGAVRRAVVVIVGVVGGEDGEGLGRACAGVVAALCGLDGCACLCGRAVQSPGAFSLGV